MIFQEEASWRTWGTISKD